MNIKDLVSAFSFDAYYIINLWLFNDVYNYKKEASYYDIDIYQYLKSLKIDYLLMVKNR